MCFKIVQTLQTLMDSIKRLETAEAKAAVKDIVKTLYPNSTIPNNAAKIYTAAVTHKKVMGIFEEMDEDFF
jgi:hypothetical protein